MQSMRTGQKFGKDEEICEILDNNFKSAFTEEGPFEVTNEKKNGT